MAAEVLTQQVSMRNPGSRDDDAFVPAIFAELIGYHLRVAQEASFQAFAKAAGRAELRPGWLSLLTVLAEKERMTPSELSRICGRDRSTLTSSLKSLLASGLIEKRANPEDQRSYDVTLTRDGREMQARLQAIAEEHGRQMDAIVGEDKAVLLAALRRIVAAMGAQQDI